VMGSWGFTHGHFSGWGSLTAIRGQSNRLVPHRWMFWFHGIFLYEFVRLDQRSILVKYWLVLQLYARSSCLKFVAGYRRLNRPPKPLGEVLVFDKILW
jgi:hypothetical protein